MTLSDWFAKTGYKKGDFAKDIGVTPQMISAYCTGDIWPSKETMRAIVKKTGGDVTPNDFVHLSGRAGVA